MAEAADTPRYSCMQCGIEFTGRKRKFCTYQCSQRFRDHRRVRWSRTIEQRRADEYTKTHRECPECKQMFRITRHDNHSKGPQICCSVVCGQAFRFRETRAANELAAFIRSEKHLYQKWSWAAKRRARLSQRRQCKSCGCAMDNVTAWVVHCEPCRANAKRANISKARKSPTSRAAKAAAKARRRMRVRQSTVERFDPLEVLDRDGWRCHICGVKTPRRLRGTYDDRAPELDHIIPLAAGGEHSRRNTACSCRKCNIDKADKPFGQMRLLV